MKAHVNATEEKKPENDYAQSLCKICLYTGFSTISIFRTEFIHLCCTLALDPAFMWENIE